MRFVDVMLFDRVPAFLAILATVFVVVLIVAYMMNDRHE